VAPFIEVISQHTGRTDDESLRGIGSDGSSFMPARAQLKHSAARVASEHPRDPPPDTMIDMSGAVSGLVVAVGLPVGPPPPIVPDGVAAQPVLFWVHSSVKLR